MEQGTIPQVGHAAVRVDDYIIAFGGLIQVGRGLDCLSLHNIWIYNLYTEQWGKHVIPNDQTAPPSTIQTCAVEIESDIFMFGGFQFMSKNVTNALWKLAKTPMHCFEWSEIRVEHKHKTPSPRARHTAWKHSGVLWTFGGFGVLPDGYLSDYGNFLWQNNVNGVINNQLLCFSPSSKEWTNVETSGEKPSPRQSHASTIVGNNVCCMVE